MRKILCLCVVFLFSVSAVAEEEAPATSGPIYVEVGSSFSTNLRTKPNERLNYIRATMQLQVKSEDDKTKLMAMMPAVKHALLMYLSARTKNQVNDAKSRNKLRQGALVAIHKEIEPLAGKPLVEDIFFTNITTQ